MPCVHLSGHRISFCIFMTFFRASISKVNNLFSKASKKNVDCEIRYDLWNAFAGSYCRANWENKCCWISCYAWMAHVVSFVKSQGAEVQMSMFKAGATEVKNRFLLIFLLTNSNYKRHQFTTSINFAIEVEVWGEISKHNKFAVFYSVISIHNISNHLNQTTRTMNGTKSLARRQKNTILVVF